MSVSEALEKLEPAWLDVILRATGHSTATVVGVEAEPLAFTGATSDMARLRITYDDSGAAGPASAIAKIRGRDDVRVQMDQVLGLFDREVRFYRELADGVPIRAPRAIYIGDGNETPLLLEDLGALRVGDQSEGLTVADAEACLDALADMHAAYWESPMLAAEWLDRPTEGPVGQMTVQLMLSGADQLARFEGRVPAGAIERFPRDPERLGAALARLSDGPHTLVHNDCRLDNTFFADDGAPVMVDWQQVADARWSRDVANLLGGNMEPDDLAANWEPLLRRYHARLKDRGVSGLSFDDCILHYRQNLIWPVGQGLFLCGPLGGDERGVGERIVVRALSHAADLDAFDAWED